MKPCFVLFWDHFRLPVIRLSAVYCSDSKLMCLFLHFRYWLHWQRADDECSVSSRFSGRSFQSGHVIQLCPGKDITLKLCQHSPRDVELSFVTLKKSAQLRLELVVGDYVLWRAKGETRKLLGKGGVGSVIHFPVGLSLNTSFRVAAMAAVLSYKDIHSVTLGMMPREIRMSSPWKKHRAVWCNNSGH